jgi:Glycosyl transferase family 2
MTADVTVATAAAPGISVIVRTLWRPSLPAALASVDAQLRDDVELVLVDALGSGQIPPPTRCPVQVVGAGLALHRTRAAQLGLDAVRTRWALFLDDDDVLLPGHLDKLATALAAAPDAVLAHTGVELVGDAQAQVASSVIDAAFEPWQLLLGNHMPIHAALFDVARARQARVQFDAQFDIYEDWDFWLQLQCLGRFAHVPGVSARYNLGSSTSPAHHTAHGTAAYQRVWRKWWALAPAPWWASALRAAEQWPATQAQLDTARAGWQATERMLTESQQVAQLQLNNAREALRQLAASELAFNQQRVQIDALQARSSELDGALSSAQHALAESQRMLEQERTQRQQTAVQLQAMRESRSWRLTAPLRWLGQAARAMRQHAAAVTRGTGWRPWQWPAQARYQAWIEQTERPSHQRRQLELAARRSRPEPLISVLVPIYNPKLEHLSLAIASVCAQTWPHWELCLCDDASTTPGVREHLLNWQQRDARIHWQQRPLNGHISAATNSALSMARGSWLVLLDQDDLLAPTALAEVVDRIDRAADAVLVYSDEDKLDARGVRFEPHRKFGFSAELLRGQNFINHLCALRRDAVLACGGWREGFEGAQDHELLLRLAAAHAPAAFLHVPQVLYHWRAVAGSAARSAAHKAYAADAAARAVREQLLAARTPAQVEVIHPSGWLRVRYALPEPLPTLACVAEPLPAGAAPGMAATRLALRDDGTAAFVLWVRPGLEALTPQWLDELLRHAARPGVAAAGAAIFGRGGLVGGAQCLDDSGQLRAMGLGTAISAPGRFGVATLTREVDLLTAGVVLMRREYWVAWLQSLAPANHKQAAFAKTTGPAGERLMWVPSVRFSAHASSLSHEHGQHTHANQR